MFCEKYIAYIYQIGGLNQPNLVTKYQHCMDNLPKLEVSWVLRYESGIIIAMVKHTNVHKQ